MILDKPHHLSVKAVARPLRVAYLIDVADCPNALLDAVFAEAYGRWGGRRTLIVPATCDGVDPRYADWLGFFDADVVYSFVSLSDDAVAAFHERYGPAHLTHHHEWRRDPKQERSFRIGLPLQGLSCLSVLPVFRGRAWGFEGPPRDVKVLDKHWGRIESPFLHENFGFLLSSFGGQIGRAHPDYFTAMTLISKSSLEDRREGKDPSATHVISEAEVLSALASPGGPLTLVQLSEFFCPYLDPGDGMEVRGTALVVGDSVDDRLLFWNLHHRFARPSFSEITVLRIPPARLDEQGFIDQIRALLSRRGTRGHNGHNDHISLHSCSLGKEALDAIAAQLKQGKLYLGITVAAHKDHAAAVPRFRDPENVRFWNGGMMAEPQAQATAEFTGTRAPVPLVKPWHMTEVLPPAGMRSGRWMVDLAIERSNDHSRYVNKRDIWLLPRRLHVERAITIDGEREQDHGLADWALRTVRKGQVSLALDVSVRRAALVMPDDTEGVGAAICADYEWLPFDSHRKKAPTGRARFATYKISDKGRYLIGVLGLFGSVPIAFKVLCNAFWRDVLQQLGGVAAEKEKARADELITTLSKRLKQPKDSLSFTGQDQVERLAREAMRAGRMLGREVRQLDYGDLLAQWQAIAEEYLKAHPSAGSEDKDHQYRDPRWLDQSIQFVCAQGMLFQGYEWKCHDCYNRNWISIDALRREMACEVCRRTEPARVSGPWEFRANPFLIEAYRDHGTEPLVWAMAELAGRARNSFVFAPSLWLWKEYPRSSSKPDVEIDAVAICDGTVYMVEAKSSGGLTANEMAQLQLAAEHIRPNVVLLASIDTGESSMRRAAENFKKKLPNGIDVEVLVMSPNKSDRSPLLPA
jgi:hypothetical protein